MESSSSKRDPNNKATKKGQLFCIISSIKSSTSKDKIYGKVFKPGSSSLPGVKKDLSTMYQWAIKNQIDYKGQLQFGAELLNQKNKEDIISLLRKFFQNASMYATTYLYYSGHGSQEGNWALQTSNGAEQISPNDVLQQWVKQFSRKQNRKLQIILDQCFAGKWFEALFPANSQQTSLLQNYGLVFTHKQLDQQTTNQQFQTEIIIRASCKAEEKSHDWGLSQGSAFTSTRYGNLQQDLDESQNPQTKEILIQNKLIREINVLKLIQEQLVQGLPDLDSQEDLQPQNAKKKEVVPKNRTKRQLTVLKSIHEELIRKQIKLDQSL